MLAAATDHWAQADSVATSVAEAPSSPNWLRAQAVATAAAARAARGALDAADDYLARAALTTAPEVARWYGRARLLLAEAAGRRPPPVPSASVKDTSAAGLVTYGLWAAAAGDVVFARRCLNRLIAFPEDVRAPLGYGPDLLEASIAARVGHWRDVIRVIGPAASQGEHDSTLLDRVNSLSLRWLAAIAYGQLGRTDSAAAMMELVIRPTRMPGNAYALRGIPFTFAHRRLALWYAKLDRPEVARAHWHTVLETVRTPDADLAPLVEEARLAYTRLGGSDRRALEWSSTKRP
jgi:hypothetical protein